MSNTDKLRDKLIDLRSNNILNIGITDAPASMIDPDVKVIKGQIAKDSWPFNHKNPIIIDPVYFHPDYTMFNLNPRPDGVMLKPDDITILWRLGSDFKVVQPEYTKR